MSRLESRTSSPNSSIWLDLPENTFRQHLVELEQRTNAVPIDPQIFPLEQDEHAKNYTLPLRVEQQLADDLAFLAAIDEGAQSVAAVCLEEHVRPVGLTVRFAALDLALDDGIRAALQVIVDALTMTGAEPDDADRVESLFDQVVMLHFRRLLARLRSKKWEKPKYLSKQHKKPLWQDFENLTHRVQFLYSKKETALRRTVEGHLQILASHYEAFEASEPGSKSELNSLKELIKASYQCCKAREVAEFARRLENSPSTTPTAKVASAIKCLHQIEKIAAYWRIAVSLVDTVRTHASLFQRQIELAFLTPYQSVPTAIGYETWATSCHVHAEVQLAVHYDVVFQSSLIRNAKHEFPRPRVIGTSKWLCYLCYLFLRCHACFVPANTHGRLYDQWTVPDLTEFDDAVCARYRDILRSMDDEIIKETGNVGPVEAGADLIRWRAEPMTSRQNLLSADCKM
ncbi:uncharacterized protein M421DRAFT_9597 [Didymella exigua CBS 183.55]|uniref:Uncharacterized protein n=1 Tax=Didymella exigua CBS 183.55 TaxID=1150837 RepID=A0A6A5R6Z3_9PLEO|nr:uncharacterized protein M421DRAFT_9597 [Didymella exigua CBS 183.55]KAF1923492.1 hypothetical protein M421DRAFT_9597 [Didymella exigua CBS 183.55]